MRGTQPRQPVAALICCTLAFLAVLPCKAAEWGEVSPIEWETVAPADYPEADVIVLFDSCLVRYINVNSTDLEYQRYVRMKVLTSAGKDKLVEAEIPRRKNETFQSLDAQTILPDGTVLVVSEDNIHVRETRSTDYSTFAFPAVDSGVVVEYRYKRYFGWALPFTNWYFQGKYYTLRSVFEIEVGQGPLMYSYAICNVPGSQEKPHTREDRNRGGKSTFYKWAVDGLLPIGTEPYMGAEKNYIAHLTVFPTSRKKAWTSTDTAEKWKLLGQWFVSGLRRSADEPKRFGRMIRGITSGCETDYAKSRAIYQWVADSIQTQDDPSGSWMSHQSAADLVGRRFGTETAKNVLLLRMLRKAKVGAWPVLICTRDNGKLDPVQIRYDLFNHWIVYAEVEQGGIFLDASSRYYRYGTLPPRCRVDVGLLIDDNASELVRVVSSEPTSLRAEISNIHLDEMGNARCSTESVCTGDAASRLGRLSEVEEPTDFINDCYLGGLELNQRIMNHECSVDTLDRLRVHLEMELPNTAEDLAGNVAVRVPSFVFASNPFTAENRQYPIDLGFRRTIQSITYVAAPEGTSGCQFPKPCSFSTEGLSFSCTADFVDGKAVVQRTITVEQPEYGPGDYPRIRSFFENFEAAIQEPVVFLAGE